ncbi:LTA synthase family protein [Viridibacillus sp. YIM B01967]|uniref:LTA synthase family protein n=1 Tax=Viridibacillus soli TaxID=2798301 RepID=A0ABS1H5E7_9BACL|nr:LTA synthase family protein [Viridibacillus soli]MBK3494621.1 LTA synthase family protein [Viridibacillus soli]
MKNNWAHASKQYLLHPYTLALIVLFIKIIAFRTVIFHNRSVLQIVLLEYPIWALMMTLIIVLFKKRTWLAVWIFNAVLSALFIVILYYTRYFSTLPSYYDVKQIYQSHSVGGTVALLGTPYDYLFFLDVILILPLIKYFTKDRQSLYFKGARKGLLAFTCIGVITTSLAFRQPLIDVSYFAKENGYLQTQIVQLYERSFGIALATKEKLIDADLEKLKGNDYVPFNEHNTFGVAKNRNVFVIQVESLQNFVIKRDINGQEITPNLNKLLEDSAYFNNVYQQIGAGNTSDAEWIMHTGLYPEGMDPTVNLLKDMEIASLPRMLSAEGYGTATFHADDITYWSRDQLYPALGFGHIYTAEDIPDQEPIGFGPADEVTFRYAETQIQSLLQQYNRVYANIVTLTSHTPFKMPEEYEYLDLPENFKDTYVGNYLQSIRYTDRQIGQFVANLKKLGLYENSVILVYGDHSGLHGKPVTKEDEVLLEGLLGHPYNLKDRFIVPVLFAAPGIFDNEKIEHLGGQTDLMPTLMNLLGIEPTSQLIGHNLFQYEHNLLGMRYYLPGGSYISDHTMYIAPSAQQPASLLTRETMKKAKFTNRSQKNINNTLSILQYSDQLRREKSVSKRKPH